MERSTWGGSNGETRRASHSFRAFQYEGLSHRASSSFAFVRGARRREGFGIVRGPSYATGTGSGGVARASRAGVSAEAERARTITGKRDPSGAKRFIMEEPSLPATCRATGAC